MGNKHQNKINYKNKGNFANSLNEQDLIKIHKGTSLTNNLFGDTYINFLNTRNSTNPNISNLHDNNSKYKFDENSSIRLIQFNESNRIFKDKQILNNKKNKNKNYSLINFFNKSIKKNSIDLNTSNSFHKEISNNNYSRYASIKSNKSTNYTLGNDPPKINLDSFSKQDMIISPIKNSVQFPCKKFQTQISSIPTYFKIDTLPSYNLPQTSRTYDISEEKKMNINKINNTTFNLYDNNIVTLFESGEIRGLFLKKMKPFEIIYDSTSQNITKFIYEDNSTIQGKIIKDKINGPCIFKNSNKTTFEGYYINNIPNGFGIYKTDNANFYGNWKENDLNGIGEIIWKDTSFYQGEFLNHMKHGIGTYQWPDGTTYQGEFLFNKMNGYGIIYYNNGNIFEGEMCDDEIHGYGKFNWINGKIYLGFYSQGKKDGFGLFVYNKKPFLAFAGFWDNGVINGPGIRIKNKNVSYELFRKGIKEKNIKSADNCIKYLIGKNKKYFKFFEMNHNRIISFFTQMAFND